MKEPSLNVRLVALRILTEALETGDFADRLVEETKCDRSSLIELLYGTLRRKLTLSWVLKRYIKRKPSRETYSGLLIGAFELLFMPAKDYATVSEMVEAIKWVRRAEAPFANAVLRRISREKEAIFADIAKASLSVRTSHSGEIVKRFCENFGDEMAEKICEVSNIPPRTTIIRLPYTKNAESLLAKIKAAKIAATIHEECDCAIVLPYGTRVCDVPGYEDGEFIVQDTSPLLALRLLDAKAGETILDSCAAPGGKTMQIASLVGENGRVVAMDLHKDRLFRLKRNIARTRLDGRVILQTGDAKSESTANALRQWHFDGILIDAPCSNSGVFRRRVDARWRFSKERTLALAAEGLAILLRMATLKARRIVYSTCSLEREEDEENVRKFLSQNDDYRLMCEEKIIPSKWHDGAYAALLVRKD